MGQKDSQVDVLVITAVKDELDVVLETEADWLRQHDNIGYPYYVRQDVSKTGDHLSIAFARPIDMGGDFASNVATRLTKELRPRCLAMVGICAGWRDKVFLGDVIVAERLFRYDAGKLKTYLAGDGRVSDVFHDIRTYNLKPLWVQLAQDFSSDWTSKIQTQRPFTYYSQKLWLLYALDAFENGKGKNPIQLETRKTLCPDWLHILSQLRDEELVEIVAKEHKVKLTNKGKTFVSEQRIYYPDGIKPEPNTPKVYVAPMGTGNKVVEDPQLFPTIAQYERKILGIEMEGSAIGIVAAVEDVDYCIITKAVTDYADHEKNDHFRSYAIEASYHFMVTFLKENLPPLEEKVSHINIIDDSANTLKVVVQSRIQVIRDTIYLRQQCQHINNKLTVLQGILSPDDLQITLIDLENHWTMECSEQIKHFVRLDEIATNQTVREFVDSDYGKQRLTDLQLTADSLDRLIDQCTTVEDLQIRLSKVQSHLLRLLMINSQILSFLDAQLEKIIGNLSTEIEN